MNFALLTIYADLLDDLEKSRIATENRIRALRQAKGLGGSPEEKRLTLIASSLGEAEQKAANELLEEWSGELRRARDAFMFAHGPEAERWREQTGEEPSWSQYTHLIHDNQRLRDENQKLSAAVEGLTEQVGESDG